MRDVFLCHSSADKRAVVRPLYDALTNAGYACWLDEVELRWGESIAQRIEEALATSRFIIIVLSPAFVSRPWPERELRAALQLEAGGSLPRVLPLLVGTDAECAEVRRRYPLLADKNHVTWTGEPDTVVQALRRLGEPKSGEVQPDPAAVIAGPQDRATPYQPKVKAPVSQRDRDRFTRNTFETVVSHFERGLSTLEASHGNIETDLERVSSREIHVTIYRQGQIATTCQIFRDPQRMQNTIGVHWGRQFGPGNALNGWLAIDGDEASLGWSTSMATLGAPSSAGTLDPAAVADYLWRQFVAPLER